jgi:hypothetical protein
MENLQRFAAYAADFEKTLADDDWSRLRPYFADDAVYTVESETFPCRLVGPDAIFRGIKKSLDGFDRKFERRDVELPGGPEVLPDGLRVAWKITYHKAGKEPYVLCGRSAAHYRDGKIAVLTDSYDAGVAADAEAWMKRNGIALDARYV